MHDKQLDRFMKDWGCDAKTASHFRELTESGVFPWTALIITGLTTQHT